MSGHSKWSTIKHKKAAIDSKRGKVFTKLIKEVTVAARMGGGDVNANPRLRLAVQNCKAESMPKDNIERAIKKGTGDLQGVNYEEIIYEGYGPGHVAIIVEAMTDNRNRTIASVRKAFNKSGGHLGEANSVQYMFQRHGVIRVSKEIIEEDKLTELVLEFDVEDIHAADPEYFEIVTPLTAFDKVRHGIEQHGLEMAQAGIQWIAQTKVEVTDLKKAEQILRLLNELEDDDDIQNVYANVNISEEVMNQVN